jgi:DNA-binding beta-propeller fold protein YncE
MRLTLLTVLLATSLSAATPTRPIATGVGLDPVGDAVTLGSMPLAVLMAPGGDKLVVVLSGWREQGIQVVDLATRKVTQTLKQDAAFYGAAFSRDGKALYVSGGNDDSVFCYRWEHGTATFDRKIVVGKQKDDKTGSRYPAGVAVSRNGYYLYVVEDVSDDLAVIDLAKGEVVQRLPTDRYPYAVEVAADGGVYVSSWGGTTVMAYGTRHDGTLFSVARITVGRHPSALLSNRSGSRLYVALAGLDRIAVVDTKRRKIVATLNDAAPGGPAEGSTPNALALSPDESKLYVAEGDNNAVAVFSSGTNRLLGRIPTDWYPTGLHHTGKQLFVVTGKGEGSHANPDGPTPGEGIIRPLGYSFGQLNGSLRIVPGEVTPDRLAAYSKRVAAANNWRTPAVHHYPPFKHVVYIIKENRTYDQVFGDLPEGDGDSALVFFHEDSTPNHRALARRFGLFDRFFTNAEVSSQGHYWSTAAYATDFDEKTVQSAYSDRRAELDSDDEDEPARGFLWTLAASKGVSFRDYGEMVGTKEGGVTQKDLGSDVSPTYPPFNLTIPDQKRADAWIEEMKGFIADGNMPQLEVMHLPSDHTAGGHAGSRTPRAYMADNDLALGRIVEALSKSPYWKDTVIFVLEDDAQGGPDHIDSHRSALLVISAYNRPGTIHRFGNTTDVIAAIEDILGLGRLSKFDYFSRSLAEVFAATPDLTPYAAITPTANMEEMNPVKSAAATMSEPFDLSAPDRINDAAFNEVLWVMLKGETPLPAIRTMSAVQAYQVFHSEHSVHP